MKKLLYYPLLGKSFLNKKPKNLTLKLRKFSMIIFIPCFYCGGFNQKIMKSNQQSISLITNSSSSIFLRKVIFCVAKTIRNLGQNWRKSLFDLYHNCHIKELKFNVSREKKLRTRTCVSIHSKIIQINYLLRSKKI